MAQIRLGDVVEVLLSGYQVDEGTQAIALEYSGDGIKVLSFKFGSPHKEAVIPAFALKHKTQMQAEMVWNRLRGREGMLIKAMTVWGVKGIEFVSTGLVEEPIKVHIRKDGFALTVRAKTVGAALKMAFMLGYFTRFRKQEVWDELKGVLERAKEVREYVKGI